MAMKRLFVIILCISTFTFSLAIKVNKAAMRVAYTAKTAEKVDFVVYNRADNGGFYVLDSNDNVLGYSDSGSFNYDSIPDNLRWWLRQYQEQIEWERSSKVDLRSSSDATRDNSSKLGSPLTAPSVQEFKSSSVESDNDSIIVGPLVKSQWSQSSPFNNYCPKYDGSRSVVGCAATALSQIMNYWQWPKRGHGSHSYTYNGQEISSDFSQSEYQWQYILPSYYGGATSKSKNAVAKLCFDVGVALDMQYSPSSSGAYPSSIAPAAKTYFSYDSGARLVSRTGGADDWDSLLIRELDAGRPIFYSGQDNDNGGHAFICDGYSVNHYFHFNWGWAGSGDGYFKTSALNVLKYKFNSSQSAVVGLKPRESYSDEQFTYIIKSDSTATLTYSDNADYSGDIVLPTTARIDSLEYPVTAIASGTFTGCKALNSVTAPWEKPMEIETSVFDDSCYNNTLLIVPDSALYDYSSSSGWLNFAKTNTLGGDSLRWSEWKTFLDGNGNFTYYAFPALKAGYLDKNLPMTYRDAETDSIHRQYHLQHWGYDTDFYFILNKSDNTCQVPRQTSGYSDLTTSWYVSDVPNYLPQSDYTNFPCIYDPENYLFTLNLVYTADGESPRYGVETFQINGMPDYTMLARYDYDKTFGKKIGIRLSYGNMIKSCQYAFVEGELTADSVLAVAKAIVDSTLTSKTASKGTDQYKPASVSKTYTVVFVGFGEDGQMLNQTSVIVNYNDIYNMITGDANADTKIDVSDITAVAAFILGSRPETFNRFSADVNNDGKIDVADITGTASLILGN